MFSTSSDIRWRSLVFSGFEAGAGQLLACLLERIVKCPVQPGSSERLLSIQEMRAEFISVCKLGGL